MQPPDRVTRACLALLAVVAAIAGVLSYAGLYAFAVRAEQSIPVLWPLVLDLAAVIASLLAWHESRSGGSAWMARAGVVALVVASTALQVSIAPDNLAARIGHGLPPVVLVWLWEMALSTTRTARTSQRPEPVTAHRTVQARTPDKPQVNGHVRPDTTADITQDKPATKPASLPRPEPAETDTATPVDAVRALVAAGQQPTAKALAAHLNVTDRTARRHLNRPDVRAALLEISSVTPLDSAGTLARTAACEDTERAPSTLSASEPAMSSSSAGGR